MGGVAGYIFSVVVPGLIALTVPALGLRIGLPLLLGATVIGLVAAAWTYSGKHHREPKRMLIVGMAVGALLLGGCAIAFFLSPRSHASSGQRPVSLEEISAQLNKLTAVVVAMQAQSQEVSKQPETLAVAKRVTDQYQRLENASKAFAQMTGNPANKQDLGAHLMNDLNLVLSDAFIEPLPGGDSLILRTGQNKFRVILPAPMRIAPRLTFHGLPPNVTPKITEHSNIGFTVMFEPAGIRVSHFGFSADAEL